MIAVDGVRCDDRFPLVEQVVSEALRGGGVGWLNDQVGVRVEHDVVPKFVAFQIDGVLKSKGCTAIGQRCAVFLMRHVDRRTHALADGEIPRPGGMNTV